MKTSERKLSNIALNYRRNRLYSKAIVMNNWLDVILHVNLTFVQFIYIEFRYILKSLILKLNTEIFQTLKCFW